MLQIATTHALKEWAVTIKALDEGKQIVLLRKGGIREKEFKLEHEEFLLYPTFEHQRADLLRPEYQEDLRATLAPWGGALPQHPLETVRFTHFAQVHEVIEVMDAEKLPVLAPFFIWTTDYAEKRLYWRPKKPLEVILVRVSRLETPSTMPVDPVYIGCKSWVELNEGVPLGALTPVMDDAAFQQKVQEIREALF